MRDGQVANRPVYAAIGVTLDGRKDVLGLWMGAGGEGAKFWQHYPPELRERAVPMAAGRVPSLAAFLRSVNRLRPNQRMGMSGIFQGRRIRGFRA